MVLPLGGNTLFKGTLKKDKIYVSRVMERVPSWSLGQAQLNTAKEGEVLCRTLGTDQRQRALLAPQTPPGPQSTPPSPHYSAEAANIPARSAALDFQIGGSAAATTGRGLGQNSSKRASEHALLRYCLVLLPSQHALRPFAPPPAPSRCYIRAPDG